jgi:hypothetical protein
MDRPTRLDDPHSESALPLVGESQHVARYVYHGERRVDGSVALHLIDDVLRIGGAVDGDEGPSYVALFVVGIGQEVPHGEEMSPLAWPVHDLCHTKPRGARLAAKSWRGAAAPEPHAPPLLP